jgi:eukaryotic translation initiation factor 2C
LGGDTSITSSRSLSQLQQDRFVIFGDFKNCILWFLADWMMFVPGADVSHPGPGMTNQPSIASLVWSFDKHAMKYAAFSCVQQPRQENIDELESMVKVKSIESLK